MKPKINPLTALYISGFLFTLGLTYVDSRDEILLFFGYDRQIEVSSYLLRWIVSVYFLILILISSPLFKNNNRDSSGSVLFYGFFLVLPLPLFVVVAIKLEWIISLLGNYRGGYSMSFYDYIFDYFIFNIVLALFNTLGIIVLVGNLFRSSKV